MKKKGFTLVELLAVIVILAIIALIATPIILGVIDDVKKGAAENSVNGYLDALEKQIAIDLVNTNTTSITNGIHEVSELSNVKVSGDAPTSGWIKLKDGKIVYYSLNVGDYTVSKTTKGKETVQGENISDLRYVCKRAAIDTLHEETCSQTADQCVGAGYATGDTITYGNQSVTDGTLTSGDAFDCDVDGDGDYDATTERFYYVSDLYNIATNTYDSNYATLIYYNNTKAGIADNTAASLISYYNNSVNENWHGPVEAIENLPTTIQWSNVSLSSKVRTITNELGGTTTGGGATTLPLSFNYDDKAARLLTAQEIYAINANCEITVENLGTRSELDKCNYLLENTKYSSESVGTYGYWIENPGSSNTNLVWAVYSTSRRVGDNNNAGSALYRGVRPVIEVPKSEILY